MKAVVQHRYGSPDDLELPVVDRTFPLGEVPAAIRRLASGRARGRIVIAL